MCTVSAKDNATKQKAVLSKNCPYHDLCYTLNIPSPTAQDGTGDIYFQIKASTDYEWVALGQGNQMAGSQIFVMYASADGKNITVSPRLGTGHVMPEYNKASQITLLEGSGIRDTRMTANIRCSDCNNWKGGSMDFSAKNADWIYAAKDGKAIRSNDLEEGISKHDYKEAFTWPLTHAKGGNEANPFLPGVHQYYGVGSTAQNEDDSGSWFRDHVMIIHGALASLAFVVLFPIGGILIRLANFKGGIWIHVGLQIFSWLLFMVAFGLGVYMNHHMDLSSPAHPIIGSILFLLLFGQPAYGFVHHALFKKHGRRTWWSYLHLGIGRFGILAGMINGGLGIQLAGNVPQKGIIGYAVVAGVMALLYLAAIIYGERRRKSVAKMPVVSGTGDKAMLLRDMGAIGEDRGRPGPGQTGRRRRDMGSQEYVPLGGQELYSASRGPSREASPAPAPYYDRPVGTAGDTEYKGA